MTKFYRYINENIEDEIYDILLNQCKPYIKDLKKTGKTDGHLLSGRKRLDNFFIGQVRKNRTSMDMPWKIHKKLDEIFYENFGIKGRSETLFCSTTEPQAWNYGNVYMIFPIGKYELLFSKRIKDLYMWLDSRYFEKYRVGNIKDPDNLNTVLELFNELENEIISTYTKGSIKEVLKYQNEVMVSCDKYLALLLTPENNDTIQTMLKELYNEI